MPKPKERRWKPSGAIWSSGMYEIEVNDEPLDDIEADEDEDESK